MSTYPPFAPALDAEAEAARLLLSQGERKRTGHLYKDCPALDVTVSKAGKPQGCKPCLARYQDVGQLARTHQRAFDAAWYAQAATAQEAPMSQPAYVTAAQANEDDMWEAVARTDIPKVDVYEAVIDTPPPAKRDHRPNKFGGKCVHCGAWVEAGAGAIGKNAVGKWVVAHIDQCPAQAPTAPSEPMPTEPGMYRYPDDGSYVYAGRVVKVQRSRTSGNLYAQLALPQGGFEYLGGGAKLAGLIRLTVEEAKQWGKETGVCCVCGAHLENPDSVAAGIGPICGGRI